MGIGFDRLLARIGRLAGGRPGAAGHGGAMAAALARLPGKNCGQCGFPDCAGLAALAARQPEALRRCVYLPAEPPAAPPPDDAAPASDAAWTDMLGRDFDFVLEPFPEDPGPRETILPFNPANAERLGVREGDVLLGRPAWVGCPVTHAGRVMAAPDRLNGTIEWCVVGPLAARGGAIEIGQYNPVAYEGLVRTRRVGLDIGRRYFFLPQRCMLQSRHSGVVTALARRPDGLQVRLEGIWIA